MLKKNKKKRKEGLEEVTRRNVNYDRAY
jgi:hypothetical protein